MRQRTDTGGTSFATVSDGTVETLADGEPTNTRQRASGLANVVPGPKDEEVSSPQTTIGVASGTQSVQSDVRWTT